MTTYQVRVAITLKPEILDPAGQAVERALAGLGMDAVAGVRIGRMVDLTLSAESEADALALAKTACQRLLVNPVMERYTCWVDHA